MTRKYELIVFDWDGTLMDSESRIVTCMQRAANDVGVAVPSNSEARDIIGLGLREAVARLFPGHDDATIDRITEAYREHWLGNEIPESTLFDGAKELLDTLTGQNYLLAVATGKSRRGLDKVMVESRLGEYFHVTRCADETFSKPHPAMLEEIMVDLNTPAHQTLVIGDTEYDMQMAANARVDAVGVVHGVHTPERLLANGALTCLDELAGLLPWLAGTAPSPSRRGLG